MSYLFQMSTLQATIPFKSRKRTYLNEGKSKINNENKDISNIEKSSSLKRQINVAKTEVTIDDGW